MLGIDCEPRSSPAMAFSSSVRQFQRIPWHVSASGGESTWAGLLPPIFRDGCSCAVLAYRMRMAAALSGRPAKAEPRYHRSGRCYRLQSSPMAVRQTDAAPMMTLAAEFETGGTIAPPPGPKIKPGSRLVREWHGRTHTVCVTQDGFEFQGKFYRSLTKIARDITGAQRSGPRFFGLTKRSATATATPDNLATGAEMASESANG